MVEMKPELPDPRDMHETTRIKGEPGDHRHVLQDHVKEEQLAHVKQELLQDHVKDEQLAPVKQERCGCSREKAPSLSKQQRASIKKPRDCIRLGYEGPHGRFCNRFGVAADHPETPKSAVLFPWKKNARPVSKERH